MVTDKTPNDWHGSDASVFLFGGKFTHVDDLGGISLDEKMCSERSVAIVRVSSFEIIFRKDK